MFICLSISQVGIFSEHPDLAWLSIAIFGLFVVRSDSVWYCLISLEYTLPVQVLHANAWCD